jgi:hypothetical protein
MQLLTVGELHLAKGNVTVPLRVESHVIDGYICQITGRIPASGYPGPKTCHGSVLDRNISTGRITLDQNTWYVGVTGPGKGVSVEIQDDFAGLNRVNSYRRLRRGDSQGAF